MNADHEGWLEAAGFQIIELTDLETCPICTYDLGTHHPNCGTDDSMETRESLASLMILSDFDFGAVTIAARSEAEGWWQYTDENGDTYTTNSEY